MGFVILIKTSIVLLTILSELSISSPSNIKGSCPNIDFSHFNFCETDKILNISTIAMCSGVLTNLSLLDKPPAVIFDKADLHKKYILLMVGRLIRGAPTDDDDGNLVRIYWVVTDIPGHVVLNGKNIAEAEEVLSYEKPIQVELTRVVRFLLFERAGETSTSETSNETFHLKRKKFSLNKFALTNGLCDRLQGSFEFIIQGKRPKSSTVKTEGVQTPSHAPTGQGSDATDSYEISYPSKTRFELFMENTYDVYAQYGYEDHRDDPSVKVEGTFQKITLQEKVLSNSDWSFRLSSLAALMTPLACIISAR